MDTEHIKERPAVLAHEHHLPVLAVMAEDSSLLPFQPSLAQATNTRLDSACKHIQQCRVSTDDMMRFVSNNSEEIQRNKYRYCIHKDEVVVGVGRAW